MQDVRIILEGSNGIHKLSCGDFYLDESNEIMYVGVGAFGGSSGGGIVPVGSIHINANGSYNVTNYANAVVEIAPYGVGSVKITENGKVNVNGKKTAYVDVPQDVHTIPYTIEVDVKGPAFVRLQLEVKPKVGISAVVCDGKRVVCRGDVKGKNEINISIGLPIPLSIEEIGTVTNSTYYFAESEGGYAANNLGVSSSTAQTTITANEDMDLTINYDMVTESRYDKLYITNNGTDVLSGYSGTSNSSVSVSLKAGKDLVIKYSKDGSGQPSGEKCVISFIGYRDVVV